MLPEKEEVQVQQTQEMWRQTETQANLSREEVKLRQTEGVPKNKASVSQVKAILSYTIVSQAILSYTIVSQAIDTIV